MPLPTYEKKDQIPQGFEELYEERDAKWHPKPPADELGEKGKLAIQKERDNAAAEKKRADDAQTELDALKRAKDAKDKGISEEELQKIRDAEATARKPILDENVTLKAENRKLKLTDRVQSLALKHGVLPDRIEDAMLALANRTDLTDQNGIVVKDKAGAATAETIDNFLSVTFKKEKPWLYKGTGGSGSGSAGSSGSGEEETPKPNTALENERLRTIAGAF